MKRKLSPVFFIMFILFIACGKTSEYNFEGYEKSKENKDITIFEYSSPYYDSITPINKNTFISKIDTVKQVFTRKFRGNKNMLFMAKLFQYNNEVPAATKVQPYKEGIIVTVSPPKEGKYQLNIYGRPKNDSTSFSGIYYWEFEVENCIGKHKEFPDYLGENDYIID